MGYEKLGFSEQDCRYHLPEFRRLKLKEGDATAVRNYFGKMQLITLSSFYCAMDVNEKGRLRNVFWTDARSMGEVQNAILNTLGLHEVQQSPRFNDC